MMRNLGDDLAEGYRISISAGQQISAVLRTLRAEPWATDAAHDLLEDRRAKTFLEQAEKAGSLQAAAVILNGYASSLRRFQSCLVETALGQMEETAMSAEAMIAGIAGRERAQKSWRTEKARAGPGTPAGGQTEMVGIALSELQIFVARKATEVLVEDCGCRPEKQI